MTPVSGAIRGVAREQLTKYAQAYSQAKSQHSRAREILPQVASLADTRGVIRLAGDDLVRFLQVCVSLLHLML